MMHLALLGAALVVAVCAQEVPPPEVQALLQVGASQGDRNLLTKRADPKLRLAHLAKCGGTFSKAVVQAAVPDAIFSEEGEPLLSCQPSAEHDFTIGLMRNPYNLLVSLWSYYVSQFGAMYGTEEEETRSQFRRLNTTKLGESDEDRRSFGEWVRWYSKENLGLASARFAAKFLRGDIDPTSVYASPGWHPELENNVANFSKDDVVDCWVLTESLKDDLSRCLRRYESEAGGVVNWTAMRSASEMHAGHNHRPHVKCDKMFGGDASLKHFVAQSERNLVREFGFPEHCS